MIGFAARGRTRLILLALVMLMLWLLAAPRGLAPADRDLWNQVRAAQEHILAWRQRNGLASSIEHDPRGCGLIGVEWSGITTTLGSLEAKRIACDPAWAIQFVRWYREQGLQAGDPVAIYSSASFPGLLLSAQAAAETLGLDPLIVVSLGASTWGANHPDAPWPVLAAELRRAGFLKKRADFYTLGGGGENGGGMAPEAVESLRRAAAESGVSLLQADGVEEMVRIKSSLLEQHGSRLLVSIGGSQANLGDDPGVLRLGPGLHRSADGGSAGNGVIAHALQRDIAVIHLLNIRELAARTGIPLDARPDPRAPLSVRPAWALLALALCITVLLTHRRWRLV
jgi:poly-gamma-glutamate system protein